MLWRPGDARATLRVISAALCLHSKGNTSPVAQHAEAIIAAKDPRDLSEAQLELYVAFSGGIPPGFALTEPQIEAVCEALLGEGLL